MKKGTGDPDERRGPPFRLPDGVEGVGVVSRLLPLASSSESFVREPRMGDVRPREDVGVDVATSTRGPSAIVVVRSGRGPSSPSSCDSSYRSSFHSTRRP